MNIEELNALENERDRIMDENVVFRKENETLRNSSVNKLTAQLLDEMKRLIDALRFYTDPKHYRREVYRAENPSPCSFMELDAGTIARKALGLEEDDHKFL